MSIIGEDKTLRLVNGDTLGYVHYGREGDHAIIYFHGLPSSRCEAGLWNVEASDLGVQLIALDRPGMGLSTRIPNRNINDYAKQVAELVVHLKLRSYSILGVSGGGPYALACAANKTMLPGLRRVGVLAGLGDRELSKKGMSMLQWLSIGAMDWVPAGLFCWFWDTAIGKAARNSDEKVLEDKVRASTRALEGEDAEYCDERTTLAMTAALRGAFAQSSKGYFDEASIVCKPWGFQLGKVKEIDVCFCLSDV